MALRKNCSVGFAAVIGLSMLASKAGADPSPKVDRTSKRAQRPAPKPKQRSTSWLFKDGVKPILGEAFIVPAEEKNWLAYQAALKKKKLRSLDLMEIKKSGEPAKLGDAAPCTIVHRYELNDYEEVYAGSMVRPTSAVEMIVDPVRFALNAKGEVVCVAFTPVETSKITVGIGCVGGGAIPDTTLFVVPKGTVVVPGQIDVSAKQVTIEKRGPAGGCNIP